MKSKLLILLLLAVPALADWTEPVQISFGLGLLNPRAVAVGDTLHVVATGSTRIYYLRSPDNGQTWTDPICPAPIDTFHGSQSADIAYSSGRLHLLCKLYFSGQRNQIFHFSSTDGGQSWGEPHQVFNNNDSYLQYPRLAACFDTVFASCSITNSRLVLASFDGGVTWGDSVRVDGSSGLHDASILYSAGRLFFIYQGFFPDDSLGIDVYARYSDDLGQTWSERTMLSTADQWDGQAPCACADSAGSVMGLWFDYKYGSLCGITGDMLGRVSTDSAQSWLLETRLTWTHGGSGSTCLVLRSRLYAIWMDYTFSGCQFPKLTYAESSDWGTSWTEPEIISGPSQTSEYSPFLFYNWHNGEPLFHCVMFKNLPGGGYDLFYMRSAEIVGMAEPGTSFVPKAYLTAYPNPFNSTTGIVFSGMKGGDIRIYDIGGRLVRALETGGRKEGTVVWDGTDDGAREVASGSYLIRAEGTQRETTISVVLVR